MTTSSCSCELILVDLTHISGIDIGANLTKLTRLPWGKVIV